MESSRCERDEDATVVHSLKQILRDCRQIAASSSSATPVVNFPNALQLLAAALDEVAAPTPLAEGEDTSDSLADRSFSEERPVSMICSTQLGSSSWLKDTLREQIASIPALVEDAIVRFFGEVGRSAESGSDTNAMAVIRAVVNLSVAKAFKSTSS